MPIRKQSLSLTPKFTISDSDSDDEICLNLVRYQEAEFGKALHTRYTAQRLRTSCLTGLAKALSRSRGNFKRAVSELTALIRQAYVQHADKTIQELIFEDALLAIRLCSRLSFPSPASVLLLNTWVVLKA